MMQNRFYMHKNGMDVCIRILAAHIHHSNTYYVEYYNLGYTGNPWPIQTDKVSIMDPSDWVDITSKINKPRMASGVPK